jgi:porin
MLAAMKPGGFDRAVGWGVAAATTLLALAAIAADSAGRTPPNDVLLLDSLGRAVKVATNQLPQSLQPSAAVGLQRQTPDPLPGASLPSEVSGRLQDAREGAPPFQFFPAVPPRLMPYLGSLDEFGNTALRPGALFDFVPLEAPVAGAKYWLSEYGLRYSLEQSLTCVNMTDVKQGSSSLGFYTFDLKAKWAVLDSPGVGTAGWISTQVEAKTGLGDAGGTQSPKSNLGTLTEANDDWSSVNGFRVPELAWQQSLRDGEVVVVAGMVSQRNYLDGNAAAHTARGEFMNSALVHSQVLPLAEYNFGLNLQWQPADEWYAMFGASVGNAQPGFPPWTDLNLNTWSLLWELGYAPKDFLGLGPGIYRIQPFIAESGGPAQPGLGFDLQQQLGAGSPFAWFGRFGFSGAQVPADASAQIGTGFLVHAPLRNLGLIPRLSNDLLGLGFVWSQPPNTGKTVYHDNEYVLESFYTLQLTPTIRLQPDLQVVWNPAYSRNAGPALVSQLQIVLAW